MWNLFYNTYLSDKAGLKLKVMLLLQITIGAFILGFIITVFTKNSRNYG